MPQLDLYSIASQFFFGILFFCVFYYVTTFYFIPSIFTILYARNYYISSSNDINLFVTSYVFVLHVVVGLLVTDALGTAYAVNESAMQSSQINAFTLEEVSDFYFSQAFEETYFLDEEAS